MKSITLKLIGAALLSFLAFVLWAITAPSAPPITPLIEPDSTSVETSTVTRVLDGDTFVIASGDKVRYIGIDTPELFGGNDESECFAQESKKRNEQLILGKQIRLERDVSEVDQYGRLLRYVYISDPLSSIYENTSINEILVSEGYAFARTFPPDVAKQVVLQDLERAAQENHMGLWKTCK